MTRLKDENWSQNKKVIKLTHEDLDLYEQCISFMREQIKDLNSAILATIEWQNDTMLVLNRVNKMKEEL
jgi:hypothetical protein